MINLVLVAIGLIAAILVDAYGLVCAVVAIFMNVGIGTQMGLIGTGFALIFFAYWTSKVGGGGFLKNKKMLRKFVLTSLGEMVASGAPIWIPYVITTSMKNLVGKKDTIVVEDLDEDLSEDFSDEDFDEPHAEIDLEEEDEEMAQMENSEE
ncbi:MAG: hypothetical protein PHS27_00565 [Candidatus Pacebacteria bacterium]|nr:hypothetical protein [Candidatus Paceibacterota bacterium]